MLEATKKNWVETQQQCEAERYEDNDTSDEALFELFVASKLLWRVVHEPYWNHDRGFMLQWYKDCVFVFPLSTNSIITLIKGLSESGSTWNIFKY